MKIEIAKKMHTFLQKMVYCIYGMNAKKLLDPEQKNAAVSAISNLIDRTDLFLLAGHQNPDEDCISSLAAMALLLKKFGKTVSILLPGAISDKISYLLDICTYNCIDIFKETPLKYIPQAIFVLDTPKELLIDGDERFYSLLHTESIIKVEIDHHLGADTAYIGDKSYRLVTEASSTCELIGFLCIHLQQQRNLLDKYGITDLLTRNIVLSVLTGVSGDSKNGFSIVSKESLNSYTAITSFFESLLQEKTHKNSTNYASLTAIYDVIQSFSSEERVLFQKLMNSAVFYPNCGCIVLDEDKMRQLGNDFSDYSIFVNMIKSATDALANRSGKIGIVIYWDRTDKSDMVQIKIRCAKDYHEIDLRDILTNLGLQNGGGHAGAIAIRVEKNTIINLDDFAQKIRIAATNLMEWQKPQN